MARTAGGKHGDGHDLGEDELVRGALEQGKRHYGKPRVANSKRGRELRANAALARFDAAKSQQQTPEPQEDDDSDTESGSDDEYGDSLPILEKLGEVTDKDGHHFFKIDEDGEDDGGEGAQGELRDLQLLTSDGPRNACKIKNGTTALNGGDRNGTKRLYEDSETDSEPEEDSLSTRQPAGSSLDNTTTVPENAAGAPRAPAPNEVADNVPDTRVSHIPGQAQDNQFATPPTTNSSCPVCTMENDRDSPTCMACGNVLKPKVMRNHWRCKSEQCKDSKFINVGDAGICALCGARKPAMQGPMGVTSADTLRWD